MGEHPILFSGSMVRAILDGRKTQTRRVVKPQPRTDLGEVPGPAWNAGFVKVPCPYGAPGDALWVRESWYSASDANNCLGWVADGDHPHGVVYRVRPSIHMPRRASRLSLRVTAVRVERLQDISEADILAEGVTVPVAAERTGIPWSSIPTLHDAWRLCWDSINGKRAPWSSNPFVWVVCFERLRG